MCGRGGEAVSGVSVQCDISNAQLTGPEAETHWYAAHTNSRHEKKVSGQLHGRGVEHFLPLYEAVHRWNNRSCRVQIPLFPGYLFVRIRTQDKLLVLTTPGVVRLVGPSGHPSPLLDAEIDQIRAYLDMRLPAEPYPYLNSGEHVRIVAGPLAGHEGILIRRNGDLRVVISLDQIMRSIVLNVPITDVELVERTSSRPHLH